MTHVQHPYDANKAIALEQLLDFIGEELVLIDLENDLDDYRRDCTALLNDVIGRMPDRLQTTILSHAINKRFIGE